LDATLWVQTSAEYRALGIEAYAAATSRLEGALGDSTWTAALEQSPGFGSLPPAVVLDVDETVLDNSPHQARLVASNQTFGRESWNKWVTEATADPVPGALEFTKAADDLGIAVFYVTNRNHELEQPTRENLEKHGFPLPVDEDRLLLRGEREGWGSDKTTRRAFVARGYRIVMLVGDDLNDFVSGARVSPADRIALAERYSQWWGSRWVILPNPTYGSWEGALFQYDPTLSDSERLEKKNQSLDPRT
jgi:acid phosphatase